MRPARVLRSAVVLRPSTILDFHRMLRRRKYRWLFAPRRRRTGPKGPSKALVDAIVEMKRRNSRWGCPRIAQQIGLAFDIQIDKDVVRRVLAAHDRPAPKLEWPFLADVPWAYERQSVEHRPLPVRVRVAPQPLGAGGHGPVHQTDRWLRGPCRYRGWSCPVPHVQPCDSRTAQ